MCKTQTSSTVMFTMTPCRIISSKSGYMYTWIQSCINIWNGLKTCLSEKEELLRLTRC